MDIYDEPKFKDRFTTESEEFRSFTKVKTLVKNSNGQAVLIKYKDNGDLAVIKTLDMFMM